ncbi:hypothetical protein UFOVP570_24 [uncultured Caudovirales phage]|uniref:Uncharacterized protein n=1 Tax=uncultured Caudovirales phage TaxID=2100421 RepID=A0A6J5MVG5_9CAUD|nr:hypothetical protein UFOVP570_24 [uncultured Caudovirales phage]
MTMEELAWQIGELHKQWIIGQLSDRQFVNKVAALMKFANLVK